MNREAAFAGVAVVALFIGLIVYAVYGRRPLKPKPGAANFFGEYGGVKVGLSFVSPPFVRIEIWGDELLISNMRIRVPVSGIRAARIQEGLGGRSVILELEDRGRDPIELLIGRPEDFVRALNAAKGPIGVRS